MMPNAQASPGAPAAVLRQRLGLVRCRRRCGSSPTRSRRRATPGATGRPRPIRSWRSPGRLEHQATSSPTATGRPTPPATTPGETPARVDPERIRRPVQKYILNLNGHSHDYERFQPIHGVTHITAGGGGAGSRVPGRAPTRTRPSVPCTSSHLRVDVTSSGLRVDAVCGPATSQDDTTCPQGSVLDSYTSAPPPPPPPPAATLYVDKRTRPAPIPVPGRQHSRSARSAPPPRESSPGQTVQVGAGTYPERVAVRRRGSRMPRSLSLLAPASRR